MTLFFYGILSLYAAHRMGARTVREWMGGFGSGAFMVGLIILPFDAWWQLLQWLKFGSMYPGELLMVVVVLVRDAAAWTMCYLLNRNLLAEKGPATLNGVAWVLIPMASLLIRFLWFAPDPGYTDYTYTLRYGSSMAWWVQYLSGLPDRGLQALAYYKLWKPTAKKVVTIEA